MIERQLQHMKRLLDDLLDVARITSGRISIHEEIVNVCAYINQAVETVRHTAAAKRQSLVVAVPQDPIYVKGDAMRIAQIFANILSNAVKFTPKQGHLALRALIDLGTVVIRVRDHGIGMADSTLQHAFELFSQADQSLDRSECGLGIGLTLVKRLVELHHGTVEARSEGLGKGSEFIVRLPLTTEQTAPKNQETSTVKLPKRTLCIMVVDDNTDAAETLAFMLRRVSHEVHIANDGPAAIDLASRVRADAVILDIGLPGLDAYQVARELRKISAYATTMLIALSGYGQEEDRRRAREAGFDHHLIKPTSKKELFRVLDEVRFTDKG